MERLFFRQQKPLKVKILGVLMLILIIYLIFTYSGTLSQVLILLGISIVLLGYFTSYEVRKDFEIYKNIGFLGLRIYRWKVDVVYPEYISIFSASFKQDNEWGSISALGTKEKHEAIVIRLFNGNRKFTLYKTNKYEIANNKARELSKMLNIEIHDAIES